MRKAKVKKQLSELTLKQEKTQLIFKAEILFIVY